MLIPRWKTGALRVIETCSGNSVVMTSDGSWPITSSGTGRLKMRFSTGSVLVTASTHTAIARKIAEISVGKFLVKRLN